MARGDSVVGRRSREDRLLGHVQHPDRYVESLLESRGEPVALSVWQASQPTQAVVFVPGTAVHPLFYEEFLDALAANGRTVVGLHPQGHGRSPRVSRVLRWDDLVGNAIDATRWAADTFGLPIVLVGSSQGSLVALLAAAAEPSAVQGVIAHNLFDPNDPDAVMVTRFGTAQPVQQLARRVLDAAARITPRAPVRITAYLDPRRVFGAAWTRELFERDPLVLRSYPLRFVADLAGVDTRSLYDGSLAVPVTVLAARGDPLFPLAGIEAVAHRLVASSVDLVVLDTDCHLVLNEAVDLAVPVVLEALQRMSATAGSASGAAR